MPIDVKDYFGHQTLYPAAAGLERAMADVDAWALLGTKLEASPIKAELVQEAWEPYKTLARNLSFLAWAYDVDLWEDKWSEETQREWVDRQWEFKTKRGTIAAIEMALEFVGRGYVNGVGGYRLQQYITPPQAFWAGPELTVEQINTWVHLMPEVRIYLGHDTGLALGDEFYFTPDPSEAPDGIMDVHAIGFDDGWILYGRRAILRQAGKPDVRLKVVQQHNIQEQKRATDFEEVFTPGLSTLGLFFDADFYDEEKFVCFEDSVAKRYVVTYDRTYDTRRTEYHLSAIVPTQEPLKVTYERNSDIGDAGPFLFFDDGIVGVDFVETDYGANMLADRLWLLDPAISVPMSQGISFFDVDRIGMPPYTMELMIDLRQQEQAPSMFADEGFVEDVYWVPEDGTHIDRACRAVVAAKSLRDKALAAFDPLRQLEVVDFITPATRVSDWVKNEL